MDPKTKELIALGASVTANCLPCLKFHLAKAREAGVSDGDLTEAIRIGQLVRKGAATSWDKQAHELLSLPDETETPNCSSSPCADI